LNSSVARLIAASLLLATVPVSSGAEPVEIDDYGEFLEHLIKPQPVVTTPWVDLTRDYDVLSWTFHVTIDEQGIVRTAQLESGDAKLRDEAQRVALSVRFEPFVRNDKPVVAWTDLHVWSRAADYLGPIDRTFPAQPDLSQVVISLKRTECFGTCPSYRVELRGNGEVRYRGEKHVLVKGSHQWRVDPAVIGQLLELFRRANYFTLNGYYEYPVTDMPTYVTRLSIGGQHKFVLDYGNQVADEEELPGFPVMPPVVTEIEDAIAIEIGEKHFSGDAGHGCWRDGRRSEASFAITEHDRELVVFDDHQVDMPILIHIAGNKGVPTARNPERRRGRRLVIHGLRKKRRRTAKKNNARVFHSTRGVCAGAGSNCEIAVRKS